jgi:hypothetical protein
VRTNKTADLSTALRSGRDDKFVRTVSISTKDCRPLLNKSVISTGVIMGRAATRGNEKLFPAAKPLSMETPPSYLSSLDPADRSQWKRRPTLFIPSEVEGPAVLTEPFVEIFSTELRSGGICGSRKSAV